MRPPPARSLAPAEPESKGGLQRLAEAVREAYLERRTGILEVSLGPGQSRLFFRDGELCLYGGHSLAREAAAIVDSPSGKGRLSGDLRVQQLTAKLVLELTRDRRIEVRFLQQTLPGQLVGPLPAILLVMGLSIHGCNETDLVARLGGPGARYRSSNATPALEQLHGLEPEMAEVMTLLELPLPVSALSRGANPLRLLRGLTKLWSIGLAVRLGGDEKKDLGEDLLPPRLLERFLASIADSLESQPIEGNPEEHRQHVAELIGALGERNHYELLGLGIRASTEEVFQAYQKLARVVHPSHASRLGLEGKEAAISVLFERATEAYLSLSDPKRRASYNLIAGIQHKQEVDPAKRKEEKQRLARSLYLRATSLLATMDYSQAVDLFREAARLDPKAEYFARLAQGLAKNHHWHPHAIDAYRRAVELSPDDAGIRAGYGEVLEEMGRYDEAKTQYKAAVELMSDHIGALEGLDRIKQYVR